MRLGVSQCTIIISLEYSGPHYLARPMCCYSETLIFRNNYIYTNYIIMVMLRTIYFDNMVYSVWHLMLLYGLVLAGAQ